MQNCSRLQYCYFYPLPHNSGEAWFYIGSPCLCPSMSSIRILFLYDNLSQCQWIFSKLGMCIEVWFGIVNEQILSIFDTAAHCTILIVTHRYYRVYSVYSAFLAPRDYVPGELKLSPSHWRWHLSVLAQCFGICQHPH